MTQPQPIPVVPLAYADVSQSTPEEPAMPVWLTLANLAAMVTVIRWRIAS